MLDLGVIEPSVSPYSSVVLVPKKDRSVWFCIDFRKLNKITEFDAEPMPNNIKDWQDHHGKPIQTLKNRLTSAAYIP